MSTNEEDLQTYLDSFDEEAVEAAQNILSDDGGAEVEVDGTLFVGQNGEYYFEDQPKASGSLQRPKRTATTTPIKRINTRAATKATAPSCYSNRKRKATARANADKYVVVMVAGERTAPSTTGRSVRVEDDNNGGRTNNADEVYDFDEHDEIDDDDEDQEDDDVKGVVLAEQVVRVDTGSEHRCSQCDYTAAKRYLLIRHEKVHNEDKPHKCSVCERGFRTHSALRNHLNSHLGNKPHACRHCEMCFTTAGELVRHTRYRHTGEKPHKCSECDYCSVELSKLRRHMRCHTGERPYQCPHCTYASPDTFKLKRHMRTHTGEKPYECDICHARFTQSNSLKAHRLIHSVGDKPVFQCELCPTTCGRKTDLRLHIQKLHHSDQPIRCKRCGKQLPDRYSYKMHVKTHEGEKCFRCSVCQYASISMRHLESHMLVHTDEKPFTCDTCQMTFRQAQLLKRHVNLYHNKDYKPPTPRDKTHQCPHCRRSFTHKGNLLRHMAVHDADPKALPTKSTLDLDEEEEEDDDDDEEEEEEAQLLKQLARDDAADDDDMDDDYEVIVPFDDDIDEAAASAAPTSSSVKRKANVAIKKERGGKELVTVQVDNDEDLMYVEVIQCEEGDEDDDCDAIQLEQSATSSSNAVKVKNEQCRSAEVRNCFGFEQEEDSAHALEYVEDDEDNTKTALILDMLDDF